MLTIGAELIFPLKIYNNTMKNRRGLMSSKITMVCRCDESINEFINALILLFIIYCIYISVYILLHKEKSNRKNVKKQVYLKKNYTLEITV